MHTTAYHAHQNKGNLFSNLLWHVRVGHINYDNLCLLKKNGVSGSPTIPRKLKQCDVCIHGKYSKQPFYGFTSRACRKLGLIHLDLCGPMHVQSTNGNKYIMYFTDDYTIMCWVYLLKEKSKDFEIFKNFHVWIQNEAQTKIGIMEVNIHYILIMEVNINLMILKIIYDNMA